MLRKILTCASATAAALALALPALATTAGPASADRTASNSVTYTNAPGPDPAAPNITTVVVSNENFGLVTFHINIPTRPQFTDDMDVFVLLDTDQNSATGSVEAGGAEVLIDYSSGSADRAVWDGTGFVFKPGALPSSYDGGTATIMVYAADLGTNVTGFNFRVGAVSGVVGLNTDHADFSQAHFALAPAGLGGWNYQIKRESLKLTAGTVTSTPKAPKAGRAFAVSMGVRTNLAGTLDRGVKVTCRATIAGKAIPATVHAFANGTARCGWKIPKAAKGKTMRGTVTVTAQGQQVSRTFTRAIA